MKKTMFLNLTSLILLAAVFVGCKKNDPTPTSPPVYVAGFETNAAGKMVATVWKNGVATALTDGTKDADAYSIFVK